MRTALDRAISLLGDNRDYVLLALAVLVLVEGAIIVLWARKAIQLRHRLDDALAEAERHAAKAAAAAKQVAEAPETYRVADAAAARGDAAASTGRTTPAAPPAPPAAPARAFAPSALTARPPAASPQPPAPPQATPAPAEEASEYTTPGAQQAAAWVLPEVAASREPAPADPAATTLGWAGASVPIEPAADFAVITDPDAIPAAPPARPAQAANGNGNGNGHGALDGTVAWVTPGAAAPAPAPVWDMAMLDSNDEVEDDLPTSGDVLLVEDDPTITRLYKMLLETRGYSVRVAADGLEGLDRVNEKRPDLVLLDIMMPRMNGIAFLQALRAGNMRDIPVVVLSNFMEKQLVDDAMSLGALEYMVKAQTRPEALAGALPHWLRGERAFSS